MRELNIRMLPVYSPQDKGQLQHLARKTVADVAPGGVTTLEEANRR